MQRFYCLLPWRRECCRHSNQMWPARPHETPLQAKTGPIFPISICNGSSSIYQSIWTFPQVLASHHCQNLLIITCNEKAKHRAWNSRRSHFSLVSCLKGQVPEQSLLQEVRCYARPRQLHFRALRGSVSLFCHPAPRGTSPLVVTGNRLLLHRCPCEEHWDKAAPRPGKAAQLRVPR